MQALLYSANSIENNLLKIVLQQTGYLVETTNNLKTAVDRLPERSYDLLLLSTNDEIESPLLLIKKIRSLSVTGLILISEPVTESTHIKYLEAGADLVVFRPYSSTLLVTQIHVLMRRASGMPFLSLPTLALSGIELDPASRSVIVENASPVHLTQLEFRLLYMLMTHPGQIMNSDAIVENVWGFKGEGNRELVRGLVQRLRAKVEPDPRNPSYIVTDPGVGYTFPHK